jgi:diguanylate cyclase (GGDEF)-like protein
LAYSAIIAFLNPTVCATLATALLVFWHYQRVQHYLAVLSCAFYMIAAAFVLQYLSVIVDDTLLRFVANAMLVVGAALAVFGMLGRYGRRPPLFTIAAVILVFLAAFGWFLLVEPDIVARILIVNFAGGFLVLLMALELRKVEEKKPIDRFLTGLFLVWGLQFFVRTALAVIFESAELRTADLFTTLYWITLTFSIAFFLLVFAVTIIAAIAIDLNEELRTESCTDPLSGLLNRRGFTARVEEELKLAGQNRTPLALIIADLDHFKAVNDRYGHAAGDNAIACFGDCLRTVIGEGQVVGRLGGEEFAVLLRGADLRTARMVAEGLRAGFSALQVPGIPPDHALSASYGVAVLNGDEEWETLLRRADRALYQAKAAGRDRVVAVAGPVGSAGATAAHRLSEA